MRCRGLSNIHLQPRVKTTLLQRPDISTACPTGHNRQLQHASNMHLQSNASSDDNVSFAAFQCFDVVILHITMQHSRLCCRHSLGKLNPHRLKTLHRPSSYPGCVMHQLYVKALLATWQASLQALYLPSLNTQVTSPPSEPTPAHCIP